MVLQTKQEKEEVKNIINNFNDIFVKMNSEVLELKEIGLKDLAYEIDHHKKGYYVWLKVNASNEAVAEFNRVVRITETVMRFIVLKEGE